MTCDSEVPAPVTIRPYVSSEADFTGGFLKKTQSYVNLVSQLHLWQDCADELPLALDAYSDTCDIWTNLSKHFPSVSDPP